MHIIGEYLFLDFHGLDVGAKVDDAEVSKIMHVIRIKNPFVTIPPQC